MTTPTAADTDGLMADVAASRARCGLPPTIEDPAVLRRVAVLLLASAGDDDGEGDG